ncbi:MAG: putative membrane protein [Candidatus Nitrotoga sp. CP45]|nr:MAG: putative membrane protein [Candidatus Nitrotoga sp. CP45]
METTLSSWHVMNGLNIPINSVALYASEQKTGSYLAIMVVSRAFDQFYGRVNAQHISPLYGAHLPLKKEIEMKKVLMFAVALMFPAFAIAESLSSSELNDAQIIHTIVTANQVFIENSELAGKKARNKNVHAFARRIITESTDVNKQAKGLAAKLNVTPEDNAISKSLKADGKKSLDQLKNLSGSEFDKAYIDAEIKFHQKVIDVVDIQLVPAVKNEELKALVAKVHPALASHLEYADTIQSSVSDKH